MNARTFETLDNIARLRRRTREGLRIAYVEGLTTYAAAPRAKVARQALYRARPRMERAKKLLNTASQEMRGDRFT